LARPTSFQQQVRTEFLAQINDGRLEKSVSEGSELPNLAYICTDFFSLEQQTIFHNNWVFAEFSHQLKWVGDMQNHSFQCT